MLIQHLIKELDPCHRRGESDNDDQNNYDNHDNIDEANDGDEEDIAEKQARKLQATLEGCNPKL